MAKSVRLKTSSRRGSGIQIPSSPPTGDVAKSGLRRDLAEVKIVGSNPIVPATYKVSEKRGGVTF